MTRVLFGIVALLAVALVVQGLTHSAIAAWAAMLLFAAFLVVWVELWPGRRRRGKRRVQR